MMLNIAIHNDNQNKNTNNSQHKLAHDEQQNTNIYQQ